MRGDGERLASHSTSLLTQLPPAVFEANAGDRRHFSGGMAPSVRVLKGPFTLAVEANRTYMAALDPDRLLAPFRREAGLEPRRPSYGNWESTGLDGHTAGLARIFAIVFTLLIAQSHPAFAEE